MLPSRRSVTPPRGTQNRVKVKKPFPSASKRTPAQLAAIREELKLLPELVKKHYTKWHDGASAFQLECMGAQALGQDILVHAATGAGKTGIAAGPHLLPSSKGKLTLMISPLLSLHEEQVTTFKEEFGLKAIAINSAHGGCTKQLMKTVVEGKHQIVILSPEMLLSRRFIDNVLRKPAFGARCLSVFIDEAHCVSHWGDSFRKQYGRIGIIRAFLPKAAPICAVSATLTPRVRDDIIRKLQIDPKNYVFVNIGNDRPAVAQVIRSMQHPMNSYRDLDFMVRDTMTCPADVLKAFLYSDDTKDGGHIVDHLNDRVCPEYRARGLVRPYNASMSKKYRDEVMSLFKAGIVRILVCTDAAGMGCDLADLDLVVQWKAPTNMSSWVQRAGRAARGRGRKGLAVMLVEKTAFETGVDITPPPATMNTRPSGTRGRGGRGSRRGKGGRGAARGPKQGKDYATLHGQRRGWYGGKDDVIQPSESQAMPDIPRDSPGEGLFIYIQTTTVCRRLIMSQIFENEKAPSTWFIIYAVPDFTFIFDLLVVDASECCDVCNARLFDRTRPSKPLAAVRQQATKRGLVVPAIRLALYEWRCDIKKTRYSHTAFSSQAILDDDTCERLASIGPITSKHFLQQQLCGWARWQALGDSLFSLVQTLDIPPLQLAAKRPRASTSHPGPSEPTNPAAAKRPRLAESTAVPHANLNPQPRPAHALGLPSTSSNAVAGPSTPISRTTILAPYSATSLLPQTPFPYSYPYAAGSSAPRTSHPYYSPYSYTPVPYYATPYPSQMSQSLAGNPLIQLHHRLHNQTPTICLMGSAPQFGPTFHIAVAVVDGDDDIFKY
ncbi:P-loop containing nucleoside triphosphate hydrolase protein [Mycena leptocephala]|nr:P-loop containing nucleoside triphosphate hydrolase protein [Mycena leptocephala]